MLFSRGLSGHCLGIRQPDCGHGESSGPEALGRSKNLVEGYFWTVLATLFVVGLCVGLINAAISMSVNALLPFQIVVPNMQNPFAAGIELTSYLNYAINQVVGSLVSGIGQVFTAICTTLLYFDLRNRKEAFDVSHVVSWIGPVSRLARRTDTRR